MEKKPTPNLDRLIAAFGSQKGVAEALGMSHFQISRIANGHYPEPKHMGRMADLLERLPSRDWPAWALESRRGSHATQGE